MKALVRILLGVLAGVAILVTGAVMAATLIAGAVAYKRHDCQQTRIESAVAEKAAQLCASELVGCSIDFEQTQRVVRLKAEAQMCAG